MRWLVFVQPKGHEMVSQRVLVTPTDDLEIAKHDALALVEQNYHEWRWFLLVREDAAYKCRPTTVMEWSR